MPEPEFQIFECTNPVCHFRCPNNLTLRKMDRCPLCGGQFIPQGRPFSNHKLSAPHKYLQRANNCIVEVVLDNLRSTLNVGSIFRTADGAGVNHIYCCGTTPTPQHPKIAKTSLGAEGFLPWSYSPNALDVIREKRTKGSLVFSLEATPAARSIFSRSDKIHNQSTLLVVGNEISGVDPDILTESDDILFIPMAGQKTSLNVAVAFGIAIYSLVNMNKSV